MAQETSGGNTGSGKKRYAIVGTGGRATMYADALTRNFREHAQLVAFCDTSMTRMKWHNARVIDRLKHPPVPMYLADKLEGGKFDQMVKETKPDAVIVTTVDCFHSDYIVRAMELGCDAITEKPMTTDATKANQIFDAIARTGKKLRVAHNYRYATHATAMRELVINGAVGTPTQVDFSWVLDTRHGADYFRRWHREMDKSGGLLIHKASHHFDLVNWWIQARPKRVFASGGLKFYGKENAKKRGQEYAYTRYTGVPEAKGDPFALFLDSDPTLKALYLDAEMETGYIRDRNVFGEPITIYDTHALAVDYDNGVVMNYSLVAYSPWEGFRVAITGTKGRIELYDKHGSHIIAGQSDDELAREQARGHAQELKHFPMFGVPRVVEVPKASGGHGGGDPVLLEQIFSPTPPPDPFGRAASHLDGAAAVLIGAAGNLSIKSGQPVNIDDLLKLPAIAQG
ncbi:MAG: Gfo/Idh/MocA family oxidoreductase [Tepidisphaeraceae bacterium]